MQKNFTLKSFLNTLKETLGVKTLEDTLHLKGKFLSTKTSWDFKDVFDTIEHNWFCPEFFFVRRTSSGGAIYNSSKSKVQKVITTRKTENVVVITDMKKDKYQCSIFFQAKTFFDQA